MHPVLMPRLSTDLIVEAPADAVWEVVGRRFHHIAEWATAITASTAIPALAVAPPSRPAATFGAPIAGGVCEVGLPLLPL